MSIQKTEGRELNPVLTGRLAPHSFDKAAGCLKGGLGFAAARCL